MLSTVRRHVLLIVLALLVGAGSLAIHQQVPRAPLPALSALTARTGWQSVAVLPAGAYRQFDGHQALTWPGMVWAQWQLRTAAGAGALLYVGVATAAQRMVRWSGELGYQGQGYEVLQRRRQSVRLPDGTSASISVAIVQRLADRRLIASAVLSPQEIRASATDDLLRTAWDAVWGSNGPYYLVRVSVPWPSSVSSAHGTDAGATRLLAAVLAALRTSLGAGQSHT